MGYLLVDMKLSLRNGSSKKGIVWQALRVLCACVLEVEMSVSIDLPHTGMVKKSTSILCF